MINSSIFTPELEQEFYEQLSLLDGSKETQKKIAEWIVNHIQYSVSIITIINHHIREEPQQNQKLLYLYLISDALQLSVKHRPPNSLDLWAQVVLEHLPHILKIIFQNPSQDIKTKVQRVLQNWEGRNIYDKTTISRFEKEYLESAPTFDPNFQLPIGIIAQHIDNDDRYVPLNFDMISNNFMQTLPTKDDMEMYQDYLKDIQDLI